MKNRLKYHCLWLFAACFLWGSPECQAQFYTGSNMTFGRKRVQYEPFFWFYLRFDRFDTYYNRNGLNLALYTSSYVQNYLGDLEIRVGQPLNNQMQFIIFNRLTDYKQSNIGYLEEENYNQGGVTKILGSKVFLYFNGDYVDFERQIRSGISEILMSQILYGSSVGDQMKSEIMMELPAWFTTGAVAYLSDPWNTQHDNWMRDAIKTKRYRYIGALEGEDAQKAGHSFFEFLSDTYGHQAIMMILRQVRESRRIDQVFQRVIGIKYKELLKDWQKYWTQETRMPAQGDSLDKENLLSKIKQVDRKYSQFRVNPDGTHVAYISNELGRARIYIRELSKRRPHCIYRVGFSLNDNPDYTYPSLAWHPDGKNLVFAAEKKGQLRLFFYDSEKRKVDWLLLENIDKVLSLNYSPDGRQLAMAAIANGQSDIYVRNMMTNKVTAVTKDIYDDANPTFVDGKILFSSNRPDDTLRRRQRFPHAPKLNPQHALFLYNPDDPQAPLMQVTDTLQRHVSQPVALEQGKFMFLSDASGISNRWTAYVDSTILAIDTAVHYRHFTVAQPQSNFRRSILDQDYNPISKTLTQTLFSDNKYQLSVQEGIGSPLTDTLPITPFVHKEYRRKKLREKSSEKTRDSLAEEVKNPTLRPKKMRQATSDDMLEDLADKVIRAGDSIPDKTTQDSVHKSVFDILKKRFNQLLGFNYQTSDSAIRGTINPAQRIYQVEYKITETTTQLSMSFLNASYQAFSGGGSPIYLNPGVSGFLKLGATDLMENHRLVAGYSFSFDFQSNEYFLSYENLERRLGQQWAFHRQSISQSGGGYTLKELTHNLYYILKYPINEVLLVKGTAFGRTDKILWKSVDDQTLREPDDWRLWMGLKGEVIYDHTRALAKNILIGGRGKLFGEYYQDITNGRSMMFVIGGDYRHYSRLWRTFIWANRLAASTSFGPSKLIYYMGSVDGELLPKFNRNIAVDKTQTYAYQTLATNMRGFTQNIRNGNSFVVINTELRFPIMSCLSRQPPRASWLRNLQLIAFADIGTAWVGWDPWSKDNAIYRQEIIQGDLKVTVQKDLNPIVGCIGLGLRTELFGYFIRIDRGSGIENGHFNKAVWHFSLGLDF